MAKLGWSPSQQESNQYAGGGSGYIDSEQFWMELLAAEAHKQWVAQRTGIPDVVFERETWQANVSASNAAGVTHHVALHTNAGGGTGAEVFHYPGSVNGEKMAKAIFKHVAAATDTTDRSVKSSSTLGELSNTKAAAVIVEFQFHDNPTYAAEIRRSIKEYATAVVKGMCEFYGIAYKPPVVTPPPPPPPPPPPDVTEHEIEVLALKDQVAQLELRCAARQASLDGLKAKLHAVIDAA